MNIKNNSTKNNNGKEVNTMTFTTKGYGYITNSGSIKFSIDSITYVLKKNNYYKTGYKGNYAVYRIVDNKAERISKGYLTKNGNIIITIDDKKYLVKSMSDMDYIITGYTDMSYVISEIQ